jgi:hypothetical protein
VTRTGQPAIDYSRGRVGNGPPPPHGMEASGYCLAFTRECFDVGSYYASAIDAWNGAPDKHPGDRNPPPAVPLFFLSPSPYDHVVFGGSTGEIVTTFNDDVRRYTAGSGPEVIAQIERDFEASYLGWTESINGVRVYAPAPPPPEDDMTPEESAALSRMDQNVAALERLWGDKSDQAHKASQTYDWSEQTVIGVGNIDEKLDAVLAPTSTGWAPANIVAAIAFAALALMIVAVFIIGASTGSVPDELQRATIYLAFVLAGGALSRLLSSR